MVTLEVPKVSQENQQPGSTKGTEQEPTRQTKTRQQDGQERHNSKSKNLQTMTRGKQEIRQKSTNKTNKINTRNYKLELMKPNG